MPMSVGPELGVGPPRALPRIIHAAADSAQSATKAGARRERAPEQGAALP
jgi:hypothetical protein